MARPQDKTSLLTQAKQNYDKLMELIDSLPQDKQRVSFTFADRDHNIRDVLVHLYEWHQLLLRWVSANHSSETISPFLPAPYNWQNYSALNLEFWQQHQDTSLEEAKALLKTNHAQVLKLIESFSDQELFQKKYFNWTGTTSLASYCVSASSSHYDWAIKKIKKHQKSY